MTHPSVIRAQEKIDIFMKDLLKKERRTVGKKSTNDCMFRKKI